MNLLAVDVGNSEIKRAIISGGKIENIQRDATAEIGRVAKEIAAQEMPVALSSVRSQANYQINAALAEKGRKLCLLIDSSIQNPVRGFYDGMGADRIADICAAWAEYGGKRPVAVIGLGTATTITAANRDGVFSGGFITLGLGAICSALTDALPELPAIDPRQAKSLEPGTDVYSSICRGTVSAHIGIVEEWIRVFKNKMGDDTAVIATGGWSELIGSQCKLVDKIDTALTLRGIYTLAMASAVAP